MSASTFLLDTHALVWLISAPERIPQATLALLSDEANTLLVSAASAWEVATKHRIGKMPEAASMLANWEADIAELRAREIPISRQEALCAGSLAWEHRDPFDRLLAAQSMAWKVPIISGDSAMRTLPGLPVQW
ncbi:MAG: type II toxin-antitoxin system VapC family toxin [Nevskiaceae bacterium]|nr:type II toxin-antitoxin system VapC family toxin [Nevskiaceae bacterium]